MLYMRCYDATKTQEGGGLHHALIQIWACSAAKTDTTTHQMTYPYPQDLEEAD
jgi:hypothetical protein